ncbi:MAG: ABC transporter permease [Lachnospiraceae bacterium]|nr:ABC transporter permease [Lachnospiraceae bacterium]
MNFFENLRLAYECVRSNKMRSVLTMLGIIIGISSVITISTIGSTLRSTIENSIMDMTGANQIAFAYYPADWEAYDGSDFPQFTLEDLLKYREVFKSSVTTIHAMRNIPGNSVCVGKENNVKVQVIGCTEGYEDENKLTILRGRGVTIQDSLDHRNVAMVSDLFVKYALDNNNPIGQRVEITLESGDVLTVYVIGVYEYNASKISGFGGMKQAEKDIATPFVVPVQTVFDYYGLGSEDAGLDMAYAFLQPGTDANQVMEGTKNYFERKLPKDSNYILEVQSLEQQLGMINSVLNAVTVAISVIAAISLIVGGIGVMNIMLVSVVERTREIGIRKALGAKNRAIEMQFLVEAVLICVIGGIIGILLGLVNGGLVSVVAKYALSNSELFEGMTVTVSPPMGAIFISFIFSMVVGIVFGSYPAKRAARMSPIDALRYE